MSLLGVNHGADAHLLNDPEDPQGALAGLICAFVSVRVEWTVPSIGWCDPAQSYVWDPLNRGDKYPVGPLSVGRLLTILPHCA